MSDFELKKYGLAAPYKVHLSPVTILYATSFIVII